MKYFFIFISFCSVLYAKLITEKIVIGGVEILEDSETTINITLPEQNSTLTQFPIRVIRGKKDGPTVFVSAAIHGDEINGIEIIRRLQKLKIFDELQGTLILIPIVNMYGYMTLSRHSSDKRDLNRYFPGNAEGSLASRTADVFMQEIVRKCDLGIDLHTAAVHKDNLPQIRINIDNKYALRLAKSFGLL